MIIDPCTCLFQAREPAWSLGLTMNSTGCQVASPPNERGVQITQYGGNRIMTASSSMPARFGALEMMYAKDASKEDEHCQRVGNTRLAGGCRQDCMD